MQQSPTRTKPIWLSPQFFFEGWICALLQYEIVKQKIKVAALQFYKNLGSHSDDLLYCSVILYLEWPSV